MFRFFALPLLLLSMASMTGTTARAEGLAAFPGAAGFGSDTAGGRGGAIATVTTLDDDGPGSLRAALEDRSDPRIVVFAVGGTIALDDQIVVAGNVTVLGQTAPAPGVTLSGARLQVAGDDVILRGLRVRPGSGPGQRLEGRDGISVGARDRTVARVVVAQNSVSWSTDENLATWYEVEDVTFQNNIVAEALNEAGHEQGAHSMGMLIGRTARRVSVVGNLFVSNRWRNPQVVRLADGEIVNNIMHNYGPGGLSVNEGPSRIDIVGNLFSSGPDTAEPETRAPISLNDDDPKSAYFVSGNDTPLGPDAVRGDGAGRRVGAPVVGRLSLAAEEAHGLLRTLPQKVGARHPAVDGTDRRILADLAGGGGAVRDVEPREAGDPDREEPAADQDGDGIPDDWETRIGSDPEVSDAAEIAPSGYAFVEEYVNALAERP